MASKKNRLATLVLGASLMGGVVTAASAQQMRCGAGKCGPQMQPNSEQNQTKEPKATEQQMRCGAGKCAPGRCGASAPKK